ncbi:MarR family transcriptional regulator [Actinotalea sp. M2MS4P-6]|uniref:MarR family winged helix-turn-helix transcriptional regulator n=1 Tax=Actinotalea sp. M2MS4P-6 TaxID=2983762 RepID=UPI0021E3A010|nr:MarR family transcriptional regulator [Actinotalea sp. M2MS4P-6]MCV2393765.1 MarR family transcriptional regulator [Actinotalea sp. M2MS4P-6]
MTPHEQPSSGTATALPSSATEAHRPPEQWPTGRLFSAVARRIEREWNNHLAHWDLNHASFPVLALLSGGPLSQRQLALASGVTEQTMSRVLARLERQGYVERHAHETDRRRHEVHLTESGFAALLDAGDADVAEAMTVRGLDAAQIQTLRGVLLTMLAERPRPGAPGEDQHAADCEDDDADG